MKVIQEPEKSISSEMNLYVPEHVRLKENLDEPVIRIQLFWVMSYEKCVANYHMSVG